MLEDTCFGVGLFLTSAAVWLSTHKGLLCLHHLMLCLHQAQRQSAANTYAPWLTQSCDPLCCTAIWVKSKWQQTPADPNPQYTLNPSLLQGSGASLSDLVSPSSSGQLPESLRQSSDVNRVSQASPSVRLDAVLVDMAHSVMTDLPLELIMLFV